MASITYKSFLMHGTVASTLTKLVDIKDYPDLGGDPDQVDTTTLSDAAKTSLPGLQSQDLLKFTANYTEEDFTTLKALEGVDAFYAVWFGGSVASGVATPTGSEGKFAFPGQLSCYVKSGGVNNVREIQIVIAPSAAVTFSAGE